MKFILLATTALILSSSLPRSHGAGVATEPLAANVNDASATLDVDDDTCEYGLTVSFKHNEAYPLPPGPEACNPADVQIADDGMPYLASRSAYLLLSDDIRAATPFDHITFDFQPCGHPPFDVFTKPHYDMHIYHNPVEERGQMTCDLLPGAPICAFPADAQTSDSGKAFYDQIPTAAKNFAVGIDTALPNSGIHYWDQDSQPASAAEWIDPVFIMGGYGGSVVFLEPMLPIEMVTGSDDMAFSDIIEFEGEDIPGLPTKYDYAYDGATGYITVTAEGIARNCVVGEADAEATDPASDGDGVPPVSAEENMDSTSGASSIFLFRFSSALFLASIMLGFSA